MTRLKAELLEEFGPFEGIAVIGGVSFDGHHVWLATGDRLNALDPQTGSIVRAFGMPARAGTAFDGAHLFQIVEARIQKLDAKTGQVLHSIPAPGAAGTLSGLAWAEGTLWVGEHKARKIHQVDPGSGKILRTIESNRFVTGVTWTDGELWHGTWEDDASEIRRVDPKTGQVQEILEMPTGVAVSGLEADRERFFCGGAYSGMVRTVARPKRRQAER